MCFEILLPSYWYRQMWGRKNKYDITVNPNRRASSFITKSPEFESRRIPNDNENSRLGSGNVMTLGRSVTLRSQIPNSSDLPDEGLRPPRPERNPTNRRSHSLTDVSIEPLTSPPPLPPRRRISPRSTFFRPLPGIPFGDEGNSDHLQLPPNSIIPVLERNAIMRNSRLMIDHPFVYFRFDSGPSENVARWIDDQPPSYEEAMKMKGQVVEQNTQLPITSEQTNTQTNNETDPEPTTSSDVLGTQESSNITQKFENDGPNLQAPVKRSFRKETSV